MAGLPGKIVDSKQNEIPLNLDLVTFNDEKEHPVTYTLTSDEPTGYKKGEIYTVTLDDSENVFFQDRDESIKKMMQHRQEATPDLSKPSSSPDPSRIWTPPRPSLRQMTFYINCCCESCTN